ncbi:hypothetical protein CEXT_773591 [Caerostris extrusa]|uniref:Secreted protein n=1 Tax=Caerostris extrusa TaxID=172846 RepID=A0AAV4PHR7_CAEEX|nr:hypothetical protein CEXT_773591 [Caerostris extrusa]
MFDAEMHSKGLALSIVVGVVVGCSHNSRLSSAIPALSLPACSSEQGQQSIRQAEWNSAQGEKGTTCRAISRIAGDVGWKKGWGGRFFRRPSVNFLKS